jgi:pilus assembly protein Flp/PilA
MTAYLTAMPLNSPLRLPGGRVRRFLADLRGQDLIEYALVASMVGLGAVAAMPSLATDVANTYAHISNSLSSSVPQSAAPASSAPPSPSQHGDGDRHH